MILLKRTPGAAAFVLFEVRLDQSLATQFLGWTEGRGGGTSAGELPSKSTSVKQESTWGSFCKHIRMQQAKKNTRNWKLISQKMTVRVYLMKSSVNVMHFHLLLGEDFKNYSVSKKNSSPLLLGFLTFFSIFFFHTVRERKEETVWYTRKSAGPRAKDWISSFRTAATLWRKTKQSCGLFLHLKNKDKVLCVLTLVAGSDEITVRKNVCSI